MAIIFAILTVIFLMGKGSSCIAVHNIKTKEEKEKYKKLSRIIGMCFGIIEILLIITSLIWNKLPEWFTYVFIGIVGACIFIVTILSSVDVIFKNQRANKNV